MGRTIVQEYGPIYGEPVNGTVQGRPNGSVYVPINNTISLSADSDYVIRYTTFFATCEAGGVNIGGPKLRSVATAQDLASNIRLTLYSDAGLTTVVGSRNTSAGLFNVVTTTVVIEDDTGLSAGDPLYLQASLVNNNTVIAVSDVITLELVL